MGRPWWAVRVVGSGKYWVVGSSSSSMMDTWAASFLTVMQLVWAGCWVLAPLGSVSSVLGTWAVCEGGGGGSGGKSDWSEEGPRAAQSARRHRHHHCYRCPQNLATRKCLKVVKSIRDATSLMPIILSILRICICFCICICIGLSGGISSVSPRTSAGWPLWTPVKPLWDLWATICHTTTRRLSPQQTQGLL